MPGYRKKEKNPDVFRVKQPMQLIDFLMHHYSGKSRTAIKQMLSQRIVEVNGKPTTAVNYELQVGQEVFVGHTTRRVNLNLMGIKIIHEDEDLLVIDKPEGMLSVATKKEEPFTAYRLLSAYVKLQDPDNKIFVLHRLDRETSGVMLFARNKITQEKMQKNWQQSILERKYVLVCDGNFEKEEIEWTSYLRENKNLMMFSSQNPEHGQLAVTRFKKIQSTNNFSLLEAQLSTGRKNQIRVHAQDLEHPISGDLKYGSNYNPIGRLCLHAFSIKFIHPRTNQEMRFESKIPKEFLMITGK